MPTDNTLPKLVRDNIPQIIEEDKGRKPNISVANDKDFLQYIFKKMVEEAAEVQNHKDRDDLIKELADMKELTLTLMKVMAITEEDIEKMRIIKKNKNGGFDKRYILESF